MNRTCFSALPQAVSRQAHLAANSMSFTKDALLGLSSSSQW